MPTVKYPLEGLEGLSAEEVTRIRAHATQKRYRERHPERAADRKASQRAYMREYTLRNKFGLSLEDYALILASQEGKCAICRSEPSGTDSYREAKALAVDHCHRSGKVRGLLCDRCNRGIGHFLDDLTLLRNAVRYIHEAEQGLANQFVLAHRRLVDGRTGQNTP
jgi:Recombination endonuclease VII